MIFRLKVIPCTHFDRVGFFESQVLLSQASRALFCVHRLNYWRVRITGTRSKTALHGVRFQKQLI